MYSWKRNTETLETIIIRTFTLLARCWFSSSSSIKRGYLLERGHLLGMVHWILFTSECVTGLINQRMKNNCRSFKSQTMLIGPLKLGVSKTQTSDLKNLDLENSDLQTSDLKNSDPLKIDWNCKRSSTWMNIYLWYKQWETVAPNFHSTFHLALWTHDTAKFKPLTLF